MIDVVNQRKNRRLSKLTIKLYVQAVAKYPVRLWGAQVSSVVFVLTQDILLPLLLARIIDILASQNPDYGAAYQTFWLAAAVLAANFAAARISFVFRNPLVTSVMRDLAVRCFETYEKQDYSFFANTFVGSLVARTNRFVNTFKDLFDAYLFQLIALMIQFVAPVIILSTRSRWLGVVFIVSASLLALVTLVLGRFKAPYLRKSSAADSVITGSLADALSNNLAIKIFARGGYEAKEFKKVAEDRKFHHDKAMGIAEKIRALRSFIIIIFQLSITFLLIWLMQNDQISVGTILLAQLYLTSLTVSLWNMNRVTERLEEALADSAEMTEIIAREPAIKDPESPVSARIEKGATSFTGVDFYYADGSTNESLFNDLNLHIPAGQKVGLVGPSGGGKTTLTKLLLRFMDIQSGEITLDGQDITSLKQDDLRRSIAHVPQEPLLFHRSIRENIAYGDPEANEAAIERAAKLAHAHDFIRKLPHGYDTLVGERGVKLSGGEKQRVAIARAMLKKAPILILDEATSALDSKSEKAIVAALDNLMKNRTTIVIAHRLSTIRKLDRIVVLKDGSVVEDGTHSSLLKKNGLYNELWNHQSGEFLAE